MEPWPNIGQIPLKIGDWQFGMALASYQAG
jgi:hypothetical protein